MEPRIIYLKKIENDDSLIFFPCYWKVTDNLCMTVDQNKIEVEEHEDFFDHVSFIKNTLCRDQFKIGGNGSEEITREEFDAFYMQTVLLINNTSKL